MTTQTAINAIRSNPCMGLPDKLLIVGELMAITSTKTDAGKALEDLFTRLEEIMANEQLEAEYETYRSSAMYQQDLRNELVARGA